ncbi:hypothetical protein QOT17_008931 [Balamuthia mandrillaris]
MERADKTEAEESRALPSLLRPFAHSTDCDLSCNGLTALPREFGQLSALTRCFLISNELTSLPREFGQLTALVYCDLFDNKLTSLPREFGQLTALVYCNLSNNELTSLPREFGQLTALVYCYLDANKLTSLLREFGQLRALNYCNLNNNELTSLPRLSSLPREFGRLGALKSYDLDNNPLAALPCSMVRLLPRMQTRCPQPFHQQEALAKQENEEEQGQNEKPDQSPPMRNDHAVVKSLWHLSGEAVLRNNLLPPGLLSSVPNPPLTYEMKERLERLQRRCDVCAHLFLEAEAEETGAEGQAWKLVRRCWDKKRGVWWELLCCSQSCYNRPLVGSSLATK